LAKALNNKKIQDNLRDGLPYPYTIEDAEEFFKTMLEADKETTYPFAIVSEVYRLMVSRLAAYQSYLRPKRMTPSFSYKSIVLPQLHQ